MNKEYNDYQIMSPCLMEQIAKAYNKQVNDLNAHLLNEAILVNPQPNPETNKAAQNYLDMEEYHNLLNNIRIIY